MYKIHAGNTRPELPLARPLSHFRRKLFSGPCSAVNGAAWLKESSSDFEVVRASMQPLRTCFLGQTHIDDTWAIFARIYLAVEVGSWRPMSAGLRFRRRGIIELASAESGAVVFAASTGNQYSLEDAKWNNGAFTKALVEGITGRADYTGKGKITINMLDLYISERVKELTGGKQTPTTAKPQTVPDFPIAVKR